MEKVEWCIRKGHDEVPQKDCTECMWDMEDKEMDVVKCEAIKCGECKGGIDCGHNKPHAPIITAADFKCTNSGICFYISNHPITRCS